MSRLKQMVRKTVQQLVFFTCRLCPFALWADNICPQCNTQTPKRMGSMHERGTFVNSSLGNENRAMIPAEQWFHNWFGNIRKLLQLLHLLPQPCTVPYKEQRDQSLQQWVYSTETDTRETYAVNSVTHYCLRDPSRTASLKSGDFPISNCFD